jgi:hypothetical protein
LFRKVGKAGDDVLADQVLRLCEIALGRDLDLQTAFSKIEVKEFFNACGGCGWRNTLMLCYLVASCYAQVHTTLSYEGWDVGSGEEDKRKW